MLRADVVLRVFSEFNIKAVHRKCSRSCVLISCCTKYDIQVYNKTGDEVIRSHTVLFSEESPRKDVFYSADIRRKRVAGCVRLLAGYCRLNGNRGLSCGGKKGISVTTRPAVKRHRKEKKRRMAALIGHIGPFEENTEPWNSY